MRKSIVFLGITAFVFSLSASLAMTLSADASTQVDAVSASTIYFKPNASWNGNANGKFAAYFFKNGGQQWSSLTPSDTAGIYQVAVPDGYRDVIFTAMKSNVNDWQNVNLQTADLHIDGYGDNLYALYDFASNGNYAEGVWMSKGDAAYPLDGGQANVYDSKYATFYQLLVYSFADGNGDGCGDFKGIIDHLDYLQRLGIGGLWLSPIQNSDSYHGYDIIDYYAVKPEYEVTVGDVKYDFHRLMDECHARGIKVILDLVLNHCSYNHPWIYQHPSWFTDDPAFFGMKDFNMYSSEVKQELKNIGVHWINEYGVDGYRLDAVKWFYNQNEMSYADDVKNVAWLREFHDYVVSAVGKDVFMVGENFCYDQGELAYYDSSRVAHFDFPIIGDVIDATEEGDMATYVNNIVSFNQMIRANDPNAIECSFLSNHDRGRFQPSYTPQQSVFAGYLNIFAPGNSFVYYGDELNLQAGLTFASGTEGYEDMLLRTPMPFGSGRTVMKNYLHGFSDYVRPYKSDVSVAHSGLTAEEDAARRNSIYSGYAEAIRAKNSVPLLYRGAISANNFSDREVGSYVSSDGLSSATVVINGSFSTKTLQTSSSTSLLANVGFAGHASLDGGRLVMAPRSVVVLDGSIQLSTYQGGGGEEPVIPGEDAVFYLRGNFAGNDWPALDDYRFEPCDGYFKSSVLGVHLSEGQEFKVATADWSVAYGFESRFSTIGDFDECFQEGSENGNIRVRSGMGGTYDFFLNSANQIVCYKGQRGHLTINGEAYQQARVIECVNPWNLYRVSGIHLEAGDELRLIVDEFDTDWVLTCDCETLSYNKGFPVNAIDGKAKVAVEGVYSIEIRLNSFHDATAECLYSFTGAYTEQAEVVAFAKDFNAAIGTVCKMDGSSSQEEVTAAWAKMETAYQALSDQAKLILKAATPSDEDPDLAAFAEKYDGVYELRGEQWGLSNFLEKGYMTAGVTSRLSANQNGWALILCLALVSLGAVGVTLLVKRKKGLRK